MTAFLLARAATPPGRTRPIPTHRRLLLLSLTAAVVVAGFAWPVGAELAPTITTRHDTPPTTPWAPAAGPPQGTEPRPRRSLPTVPTRPLAPVPPVDGRDAPDPFILDDGARCLLYNTQVGFHNVCAR
jgi:hypothetical protein